MPLYREQGVVLRTQKLGEADRIVTLLTHGRGLMRAVAKGVRRTSSKFGARLEPFMVVDVQCVEGRTLDTITQAVTLGAYGANIGLDYERYRAANVIAETAQRLTEESGPSPDQFSLLVGALRTLASGTIPSPLVRESYLLRAVSLAGWTPGFDQCVRCAHSGPHTLFVMHLGGVVCEQCRTPGATRLGEGTVELLRALVAGHWEQVFASSESEQAQAASITAGYVQWHLERRLRSLSTTQR